MQITPCVVVDCPACGQLMRMDYTVPAFRSLPEIFSFTCDGCGEIRTAMMAAIAASPSAGPLGANRPQPVVLVAA